MSDHSRRAFIKHASIGAAAAGAATIIPMSSADAATREADKPTETGPQHDGSFTVWVRNAKSGEIAVLVGEQEVVHHDKALAAKLARIAAKGAK